MNFCVTAEEFSVPQLWDDRTTTMRRSSHIYETIVSYMWDAKFFSTNVRLYTVKTINYPGYFHNFTFLPRNAPDIWKSLFYDYIFADNFKKRRMKMIKKLWKAVCVLLVMSKKGKTGGERKNGKPFFVRTPASVSHHLL